MDHEQVIPFDCQFFLIDLLLQLPRRSASSSGDDSLLQQNEQRRVNFIRQVISETLTFSSASMLAFGYPREGTTTSTTTTATAADYSTSKNQHQSVLMIHPMIATGLTFILFALILRLSSQLEVSTFFISLSLFDRLIECFPVFFSL